MILIYIALGRYNLINEETCPWSPHLAGSDSQNLCRFRVLGTPMAFSAGMRGVSRIPKYRVPFIQSVGALPLQSVLNLPVTVPNTHTHTHTHLYECTPIQALHSHFYPDLWLCSFSPFVLIIRACWSHIPYFRTLFSSTNWSNKRKPSKGPPRDNGSVHFPLQVVYVHTDENLLENAIWSRGGLSWILCLSGSLLDLFWVKSYIHARARKTVLGISEVGPLLCLLASGVCPFQFSLRSILHMLPNLPRYSSAAITLPLQNFQWLPITRL